jgi:Acyl-CoA synthetase (NDP forming)
VEDPVTMFEAAVLLSKIRRLNADGVAAALQSGGACTLFAEAAGAQGLSLPEFSSRTRAKLRRALPHYASQNNPLDVTGQAAVETDIFCDALDALAHDPAVGVVVIDAFPPRMPGEAPWADPVLAKARALRRETGVAFVSAAMGPLAYLPEAAAFTRRWTSIPFLQGHRATAGALKALISLRVSKSRSMVSRPAHANRAKALRLLKGRTGPLDEATGARVLEMYGVRRPKERAAATPAQAAAFARVIGFPVAVKALAPEVPHKARLGGVRLGLADPVDVEVAAAQVLEAARRAGAASPKVLVQEMVAGAEVLVGAVVDDRFGPMITVRPGGTLAETGPKTDQAVFVPCPLTPKQARSYLAEQAARCGLEPGYHDLVSAARAVEGIARAAHDLRSRLASLEANPLLVGPRGAVAVDALAETRPRNLSA